MGRFDRRTSSKQSIADAIDSFNRSLDGTPSSGSPFQSVSGGKSGSGQIMVVRTASGRDASVKIPSNFPSGERTIVVNRGPGTITVSLPPGSSFINGSTSHSISSANSFSEFIRISAIEFVQR